MEKIRILKIRKYGKRGFALSLPEVWISDNKLNDGDKINVFRENETLIIKPKRDLLSEE